MTATTAANTRLTMAADINPLDYHRPGCEHDRPHAMRHRFAEGIYV